MPRSLSIATAAHEEPSRSPFQLIETFTPNSWHSDVPRIVKATSLFGHGNELYEAAIKSHDEHNRRNRYHMSVLRERIVNNYLSKPAYLLSLLVSELAKPANARAEWLMWLGPDVILLNPQIPLEIFLPPDDFDHMHFLATHDSDGLNGGVFFLHVHEWSVKLLIEIMALPRNHPALKQAAEKDELSMEMVVTSEHFRGHATYQPRRWYNAYQLSVAEFEGQPGDLLVHFHDLEGDKWSAMANALGQLSRKNSTWSVPLAMTTYESEIAEYWGRLRKARKLLQQAEKRRREDEVDGAAKRLEYAVNYEADLESVMNSSIDNLKKALGIKEGWP